MDPYYFESIAPELAKQIAQDNFIDGENMSYFINSDFYSTVLVQRDNDTGKVTELTLEATVSNAVEDVPKIESYRGDYDVPISKWSILQYVLIAFTVLGLIGCVIALKVIS